MDLGKTDQRSGDAPLRDEQQPVPADDSAAERTHVQAIATRVAGAKPQWQWLRRVSIVVALVMLALLGIELAITWSAERDRVRELALHRDERLQAIDEVMLRAPERLMAFGGAARRFHERLELGDRLGTGDRSRAADDAVQLAASLAADHPDDAEVWRTFVTVLMDVGDDAARTTAAVEHLLACPAAQPGDRMLAAVWSRLCGCAAEAERLRAGLPIDDPGVAYWSGFWFQHEQNHAAAAAAFSRALAPGATATNGALPVAWRHLALLHRGWCRACPDLAQFAAAEDDLQQAMALRPRHAAAPLLLAALRCVHAESDADLANAAPLAAGVLQNAPPWLHVVAARLLLALAEPGVVADGPVAFGAEFSPIAAMPVQPAFANAFATVALSLLDGVLARANDHFEARFHRITALALLGRHGEAIAAAAALRRSADAGLASVVDLQIARVHLAAGSTTRAFAALERVLAVEPGSVLARRLEAVAARHVGDARRQLRALEIAAAGLTAMPRDVAVFPDAAVLLPEIQLERGRTLAALGRRSEALALLESADFGGPLGGAWSRRVVEPRHRLLAELRGVANAPLGEPEVADETPLRWVGARRDDVVPADACARIAVQRGWLPLRRVAAAPCVEAMLHTRGALAPHDCATAPFAALLPNLATLLTKPGNAATLLAIANTRLGRDVGDGDARLLRALVLHANGDDRAATTFLASTLARHEGDVRGRCLLAITAAAIGDRARLRVALGHGRDLLTAGELDLAATTMPTVRQRPGAALLDAAQ